MQDILAKELLNLIKKAAIAEAELAENLENV